MAITLIPPYILDSTLDYTFNNVTATGNIVVSGNSINLTYSTTSTANLGNVVFANYFRGDGSLLTGISGTYSNSNVALYLPTYAGNLTASNTSFTGANVFLGNVSNLHITGGSSGQVLRTDGSGTLTWVAQSGGSGGSTLSSSTLTISSNVLTIDLTTYVSFEVTLNATVSTVTITNVTAAPNFVSFILIITGDGTARAITWPVSFKWPNGTAPSITSTLNKKDVFVFFTTDGGTTWEAMISGQNL